MEYIYAVYKEQSFTRAAEKLYISQPCLSAAVKKIEEEIGMPLFERRYSSIRPTKIGYEYIAAAEKMMEIEREFASKAGDMGKGEWGEESVGGSSYVASYILPHIVRNFGQLYPKIDVSITETASVDLLRKLDAEELDFVIDSFDRGDMNHEFYPLLREKILLAVPAASKCNEGLEEFYITPEDIFEGKVSIEEAPKVSIDKFRDEQFILLKNGNSMYHHATEIFSQCQFEPKVVFRLDQLMTTYRLAASGNGSCFVSDTVFKYHRFTVDVLLYNIEGTHERHLYVARKRSRYTSRAMEKFIETAQSTMSEVGRKNALCGIDKS